MTEPRYIWLGYEAESVDGMAPASLKVAFDDADVASAWKTDVPRAPYQSKSLQRIEISSPTTDAEFARARLKIAREVVAEWMTHHGKTAVRLFDLDVEIDNLDVDERARQIMAECGLDHSALPAIKGTLRTLKEWGDIS
ncbi:hypothetical protein SEA_REDWATTLEHOG_118 [Gordonia phage RedWattleHog]|uniref:Uncharacterized protein n=1 Tax=Gordonia phage Stormageddon TaxID=2656541 RepID=A0A649VR46_9CAUD|nr:hypothetical protein KHQ86_gp183 [Gordonia phage Stormageddon]QGJ94977.1 hypothetical protein SEA_STORMAGEDDON_117 [Gordonia phage Stormageddon]QLF83621.1 hypothetical protein SEA_REDWATTLEHOG_118 [Gordonia phage RedWattleHog]